MTIYFERPVGAPADVAELEYIAALQQTEPHFLRLDGSISANDIRLYLKSRHGLVFSLQQIEESILSELGGCTPVASSAVAAVAVDAAERENDGNVDKSFVVEEGAKQREDKDKKNQESLLRLDIVQQTAMLLAPTFLQTCNDEGCHDEEAAFSGEADQNPVVSAVFALILSETELQYNSELTKARLIEILAAFGEDSCWSANDLDDMMKACRGGDDSDAPILLNETTFLRALTSDIRDVYDTSLETRATTLYGDAQAKPGNEFKRIYTASNIDFVADTFRSFAWQVITWFMLTSTFFAYFFKGVTPKSGFPKMDCVEGEFGCPIVNGIITWIDICLKLTIFGLLLLFFTTLGNSIYLLEDGVRNKRVMIWLCFFAMLFTAYMSVINFFFDYNVPYLENGRSQGNAYFAYAAVTFGCILVFIQIGQLLRLCLPHEIYKKITDPTSFLTPRTFQRALKNKKATHFKVNKIIDNALSCHQALHTRSTVSTRSSRASMLTSSDHLESLENITASPSSLAVLRYHKRENETETVGGVRWTWRNFRNGKLFEEEGFWMFPRLLSSNIVQWLVVLVFFVLAAAGVVLIKVDEIETFQGRVEQYEFNIAFVVGSTPALIAAVAVATVYIPSAVSNVLRFRSGVYGSLKDKSFLQNRYAMDTPTLLFGAALWGAVAGGLAFFGLIGGSVFLLVWSETRQFATAAVANAIGATVTAIIKILLLIVFRRKCFSAFYRERPAGSNIMNAMLESWNLGLASWLITIRAAKLLIVAIFYIGRLDTPLLAPGVGWAFNKVPMDGLPFVFNRDLLVHDAHRHPYIERLGYLYLLKLRHGTKFGSRGGAAFRILFTLALMPWLRSHRNANEQGSSDLAAFVQTNSSSFARIPTSRLAELELIEQRYKALTEQGGRKSLVSGTDMDLLGERSRKSLFNGDLSESEKFFTAQSEEFAGQ